MQIHIKKQSPIVYFLVQLACSMNKIDFADHPLENVKSGLLPALLHTVCNYKTYHNICGNATTTVVANMNII